MPANHTNYDNRLKVVNNMNSVYEITFNLKRFVDSNLRYSYEPNDVLYWLCYDRCVRDLGLAVHRLTEFSSLVSSNAVFNFTAGSNRFGYAQNANFRTLYSNVAQNYRIAVRNFINALSEPDLLNNGLFNGTKSGIIRTTSQHLPIILDRAHEIRRLAIFLYQRAINTEGDFNF